MKRLLLLITVLVGLLASASAQTLNEYLAQRKKLGITQAVGVASLETLIGSRTVEVQGIVKGFMSAGDGSVLFLEKTDGDTLMVSCKNPPEWLIGNQVHVRLLVKATRAEEYAQLRAELIAAAPEAGVKEVEDADARKRAAANKKPASPPKQSRSQRNAQEWNLPVSEATPIYAGFIKKRNSRLSDAEAYKIAQGIIGFSLKYGVDARLIMAMIMIESGFNPNATSRAGAMGLGQLMPGTAKGMGVSNAYDSFQNLNASVRIIRGHIDKYQKQTGDDYQALVLALAAYNAGSGAVRRHGGVPPYRETQNHIDKVIKLYNQLCGG